MAPNLIKKQQSLILPHDVINEVFAYVDTNTLANAAQVCKRYSFLFYF